MSDFLWQLERALEAHNIAINGNIKLNTSKFQRFRNLNSKSRGSNVFIKLHGDQGATFGDWNDQDNWITWWAGEKIKPNYYERQQREIERQQLERYQQQRRAHANERARQFWYTHKANADPREHAYALRKNITPYYAKCVKHDRWIKDVLIVPIRDINYELQTIQIIKPNGFKRPWKGTTYKNNMVWLCLDLPDNYQGIIRVCEGYATGCTIFHVTGAQPVVCALNAYNILNVATLLKRKYVHANIKICADNDIFGKVNTGLNYGSTAAKITGGGLHYPVFPETYHAYKPTDYNDLYNLFGFDETKKQLIAMH